MKTKTKIILAVVSLTVVIVSLIVFLNQKEDTKEKVPTAVQPNDAFVDNLKEGEVVISDKVKMFSDIINSSTETTIKFKFTVGNTEKSSADLTYETDQKYDYKIKDKDMKDVYTHSKNITPKEKKEVKKLEAGEREEFEVDITEVMKNIKEGNYTIEICSTAKEVSNLKASMTFTK